MGVFEILMISIGLSMDAFAAAICKGLSMRKVTLTNILKISFFFGGFQALMPVIGYFLGNQFEQYIVSVDHWVAFFLLLFIGGKMIIDIAAGGSEDETHAAETTADIKEILILAIATSIDALAVGISFAFLKVEIASSAFMIGITTFILSAAGVTIGKKFGFKYKNKATVAGGVILILIGTKILLEHLGII